MKQHITIDQLNELSEKGKENLDAWWWKKVEEWGDPNKQVRSSEGNTYWSDPLLSIGQIIEFLDEHKDMRTNQYAPDEPGSIRYDERWHPWRIDCEAEMWWPEDRELVDYLWEACREILNHEE